MTNERSDNTNISKPSEKIIYLLANGDQRQSANRECWPAQKRLEDLIIASIRKEGWTIIRAHNYDEGLGHGFIYRQKIGIEVIRNIPKDAPLIVASAVWQYSHHILAGLYSHNGPILTIANWSGQWPGLVGLLNLNASLRKMGVTFSTIWSKTFDDAYYSSALKSWLQNWKIEHDDSHVRSFDKKEISLEEYQKGKDLAKTLIDQKAILGVFDEGCMGMYNAIIEDKLLNELGVFKERLSQSALVAEMRQVTQKEAISVFNWLIKKGMSFNFGNDPDIHLTKDQVLEQCKMYIAAIRIADDFGCDAIGIQYQLGLKDMAPASDLAEGLLNNVDRPPVYHKIQGYELYPNAALPHFNEVDEPAGLDALLTNRIWNTLSYDPATTLHDIRWGDYFSINGKNEFIWLLEISGAIPASHLIHGYKSASSERQPPMYFPLGGGTLRGISKPGEIVWSRIFVEDDQLKADLGRGTVVSLPHDEEMRRRKLTTPQWPNMNVLFHGVSRDQMMARHCANHVNVVYTPTAIAADKAVAIKAAMLDNLGIKVNFCGI